MAISNISAFLKRHAVPIVVQADGYVLLNEDLGLDSRNSLMTKASMIFTDRNWIGNRKKRNTHP